MDQLKDILLNNQMLDNYSAKSSTLVDLSYLPILGSFLLGLLLKDKIGLLRLDSIGDEEPPATEKDKSYWTNPDLYNSVYDPMPDSVYDPLPDSVYDPMPDSVYDPMPNHSQDEVGFDSSYNMNYPNTYNYMNSPQETYLTTVTPRLQRSFIPLQGYEGDSLAGASQIDKKLLYHQDNNRYDNQYRNTPSPYNYDYTMTVTMEDLEKMMLNNQYPYFHQVRDQPRTYQDLMVTRLGRKPKYQSRPLRRFSNQLYPRQEMSRMSVQEAPEDGTWAGSSDWVANWVGMK